MQKVMIAAACCALVACGPNNGASKLGWSQTNSPAEVVLSGQEAPDMQPFRLVCTKAGTLTLSAGQQQVGMANMAAPFAMTLAGASFPATLVPGSDGGATFGVTAPLSPELLAALRDSTTARISVNDGYAFAESAVDQGQTFEKFVADCTALTGIAAKP